MTTITEEYSLWPDENDVETHVTVELEVDADDAPEAMRVFQRALEAMSDEFKSGFVGIEVVDDDE